MSVIIYYRAMHVVLARYCYRMSSVRPSVCLSVTLTYAEHIGWISSELVTRIIILGSFAPWSHNTANLVQREHP